MASVKEKEMKIRKLLSSRASKRGSTIADYLKEGDLFGVDTDDSLFFQGVRQALGLSPERFREVCELSAAIEQERVRTELGNGIPEIEQQRSIQ